MNKIVLWDFDGVIVPSWQASFDVHKMSNPNVTEEEHRSYFEGNIYSHSVNNDFEKNGVDFWEHYVPKVHALKYYDGIDMVILDLCSKYTSVIVSSGSHDMIHAYLVKHNLRDCFKKIYGFEVHTSKIEKIGMALKEFDSDNNNSVFITDTLGDIKEAEAHNMKTIAVTWGYHQRETLEKGKPDIILDEPQKLVEAVENLLS